MPSCRSGAFVFATLLAALVASPAVSESTFHIWSDPLPTLMTLEQAAATSAEVLRDLGYRITEQGPVAAGQRLRVAGQIERKGGADRVEVWATDTDLGKRVLCQATLHEGGTKKAEKEAKRLGMVGLPMEPLPIVLRSGRSYPGWRLQTANHSVRVVRFHWY